MIAKNLFHQIKDKSENLWNEATKLNNNHPSAQQKAVLSQELWKRGRTSAKAGK
jgi:hypothetical protein